MILTIEIEGEWWGRDLAGVLDDLDALAGFIESGEIVRLAKPMPPKVEPTSDGARILEGDIHPRYLRVVRFEFQSPGSFDLLGAAKVVEQIRIFLEFLINLFARRNDRKLELEERKVALAERRLLVLARLREEYPQFAKAIEEQAADDLIAAVSDGRITRVTLSRNEQEL